MSTTTTTPALRLLAALTKRTLADELDWQQVWRGQNGYEVRIGSEDGQLVRVTAEYSPYRQEQEQSKLDRASVHVLRGPEYDSASPQLWANMHSANHEVGQAVRLLGLAVLEHRARAEAAERRANVAALDALANLLEEGEQ